MIPAIDGSMKPDQEKAFLLGLIFFVIKIWEGTISLGLWEWKMTSEGGGGE